MESLGARLTQTRESKGYTLEQIARDTHIAKRFLEALENEDFSVFPGEPYLVGFMRTYSNYLGLDTEETVSLYHNMRLQEQPPPIDELISRGPVLPIGRILVITLLVIVVGVVGYLVVSSGMLSSAMAGAARETAPARSAPTGQLFEMIDEIVEQRFAEGDRITVPVRNQRYDLDLVRVGDGVTVQVAEREERIGVDQEVLLDVSGDSQSDLRIIVRSVNTLDNPPTVVMRLDRGTAAAAAGRAVIQDPVGEAVQAPSVGSTLEPSRAETVRLIAAYDQREEFVVEVRFQGNALFRYQVDDDPRVEQYFQTGGVVRTSAQREFKFWVSNAASARLRVAGQDISLGGPGAVTAGLVAWVPDPETNRVLLELIPVY